MTTAKDLQRLLLDPAHARARANGDRPGLLGELKTGDWLDQQTFPPLQYAVPGLVPEGFTLNVGPPKIGKSWEVLDFALAIAAGGRALGHIPIGEEHPVLLLALEDSDRRVQDRCRKLLDGGPIPAGFHYMTRTKPGEVIETVGEWLDMYGDDEPSVFLDTLGKVMPPAAMGESAYQRDYRVGSALKRLADDHPGSAVLVNHHDRKAGADDFVDSVSGTHGLAGAADTIMVLCRHRQATEGTIKVTGRDVPEGEYALTLTGGMFWTLTGGDLETASLRATEVRATAHLGDRSVEVLAYVNTHPEGVAPKQVTEALDLPDARRYMLRLWESNRIRKAGRGLYQPLSQQSQVSQPNAGMGHGDSCDTLSLGDDE